MPINLLSIVNIFTVILVFFIYFQLLDRNKYMFLSILIFVPHFWALLSVFYIESKSIYITEQDKYAYLTGASFKLGVYLLILMFSIYGITKIFSRLINNNSKTLRIQLKHSFYLNNENIKKFLLNFFIFLSLLLVMDACLTFVIYKNQITRFNFNEKSILINDLHLQIIYAITYPILFLLGRWYAESQKNGKKFG